MQRLCHTTGSDSYFGRFDARIPHLKRTLLAFAEFTIRSATPKITTTTSKPKPVYINIQTMLSDTTITSHWCLRYRSNFCAAQNIRAEIGCGPLEASGRQDL
jgi:hypothetical protein